MASAAGARPAVPADAGAIARIYNQGIEDRVATFETTPRTASDVTAWFDGKHPIVVVEREGQIVAYASSSSSSGRCVHAGNLDFSVYVKRSSRGAGFGRVAMTALIEVARAAAFSKLVSGVFPENVASRRLLAKLGFREVGTYARHGRLDGAWRDVVIVELLL